jgi:transcriptional regulator with XRE-family HTH domain
MTGWAERLGKLIKATGLTDAEFARRSGIAQSMISKVLSGERGLGEASLRKIEKNFRVDLRESDNGHIQSDLTGTAGGAAIETTSSTTVRPRARPSSQEPPIRLTNENLGRILKFAKSRGAPDSVLAAIIALKPSPEEGADPFYWFEQLWDIMQPHRPSRRRA